MQDTFSILFEAGYLFKYKDIVWQSYNDEESEEEEEDDDEDSDDEDNELAFDRAIGSSFKQNRKNSKNTSPTHRQYSDEDFSANYERN